MPVGPRPASPARRAGSGEPGAGSLPRHRRRQRAPRPPRRHRPGGIPPRPSRGPCRSGEARSGPPGSQLSPPPVPSAPAHCWAGLPEARQPAGHGVGPPADGPRRPRTSARRAHGHMRLGYATSRSQSVSHGPLCSSESRRPSGGVSAMPCLGAVSSPRRPARLQGRGTAVRTRPRAGGKRPRRGCTSRGSERITSTPPPAMPGARPDGGCGEEGPPRGGDRPMAKG